MSMPLRRLRLANTHTGEAFDGPFRDDIGPIKEAMSELSVFLRDHHSGETIAIDVGVLDFLASVMDAVGATKATILSAYRTRETNADPPPLKWSTLSYGFALKEDRNA